MLALEEAGRGVYGDSLQYPCKIFLNQKLSPNKKFKN